MPRASRLAIAAVVLLIASGCSDSEESADPDEPASGSSSAAAPEEEPYELALSEPREDSVYPDAGDDRIDTLHHDLDLAWTPRTRTLTGTQQITFRAARDADAFVLDLSSALTPSQVRLDDRPVTHRHRGHVLTVTAALQKDDRHVLSLRYRGRPKPVAAPSGRSDTATLGAHVEPDGQLWAMQEPYGAFTWYAVNDQPSDKALYSFRLSVPAPWVGVANGRLVRQRVSEGRKVTAYELTEPASSYLTTVAFGPYRRVDGGNVTGTPLTYWVPRGRPDLRDRLAAAERALPWVEKRLGRYPFDTLGLIVVPGMSGMETQTMITLGDDSYLTSPDTITHEIAHHWWGDQVTPCDWRDVWMNEGMATYLQMLWVDDRYDRPVGTSIDIVSRDNDARRAEAGPPGDYDPTLFADDNVYFPPATMWHELRQRLGDATFWRLVRRWPASHDNTCATREQLIGWWSEKSGEDLSAFFDDWLLSETDPD